MTSTLKERWNRLIGNHGADSAKNGAVESIDDTKADAFVEEHLGGIDPERLIASDEAPKED